MTLLDMVTQNTNTGTIPKGLPFDICLFVLWFAQPSKREQYYSTPNHYCSFNL